MSELEHYGEELTALEERIQRLAIACGIELTDEHIVALIHRNYAICPHGPNPKSEELRGLLMLKYNIEEHCIADIGPEQCLAAVRAMNEDLRKRGFNIPGESSPGAD